MKQSIRETSVEMANLLQKIIICCHRKEEQHASKFDVSTSECRTLRVFRNEDELTMKELSEKMNLAMSRMTRIIDGLVEKELIERGMKPNDRRVCLVHLTSTGKQLVTEIEKNYLAMNKRVLENIEPEARPEVLKALHNLVDALQHFRTSC